MSSTRPRILLLSAYDAASHKRWREQLIMSLPEFDWHCLTLPPRFFRWRIRGNALSWLNEPALQEPWDLIIATSMTDLVGLRGFHQTLTSVPTLLYMHENQFAFPESSHATNNVEPCMINLFSAVAADHLVFNSEWNRQSFLQGVSALFKKLPDQLPKGLPEALLNKSSILPVPLEDKLFIKRQCLTDTTCPHLLWNHRWEYDKGPDRLLKLLDSLVSRGQDFRLSLVGEQFRQQPEAFAQIQQVHHSRLLHFGYQTQIEEYHQLLQQADIVLSTALHDFQGLSMLEAMPLAALRWHPIDWPIRSTSLLSSVTPATPKTRMPRLTPPPNV
ncbi:tRNA-queuosine alpha-mannosyltransferase domain-containing protein [Nitrincola sp. A-D6]|uniref:tRNA-queuosine alpha-mannosyltransferase domain-containing protein n=1 Tax=Nitrincola sp. A-D6 TaxID=1545442 RepID=UPI000AF734EF|nr:DUF3524 domain-containing protein [Nitrincola sp. A-D6]